MDGGKEAHGSLWVWTVRMWGFFSLLGLAAAAPPHLGEDFLVAFMQNGLQQTLNSDFKLLLTAYSPFTSVTISMKKPGLRMTLQVTPGQPILVKVPPQAEMVGSKSFHNALVVRATNPISLVMVNEKPTSVDTALVYPVHSWGTEYYVVTPNVGTDRYGEFVVAAWEEPTQVEVHLKATVTYQGQSYPRGTVLPIKLEPFQAVQLQSPSDLSGTRIVGQKPVAVFTGHTCLARFTHCDHLAEQLQPVAHWGTTFIVPPLPFETQSDIVYVSTSSTPSSTRVESHHGDTKAVRDLRPGRSTLYGLQASNPLVLSADTGVQVVFFADGGQKDTISYDPFFMTVPDVSSYCHSYKVLALEGYQNYALLVAKTSETSGLTLNKVPLRNVEWKPVPGTDYSWAGQSLGGQFAVHAVEHKTSPFGLLSVGIREQKAYGSPAVCDSDPCRLVTCRAKETCKLEKGEASCTHDYMGTCMGSQSPQYHTFDGVTVDIQGGCSYTLVKYCGQDPTLVPFKVEEKKEQGDSGEGLTTVYVYAHKVSIQRGEGGKIQVNDKPTNLPATLDGGKIRISRHEGRVVLQTDFGLQVTYDDEWAVMVAVPSSYFGATCGLCGNFNEDTEDEATLPDGTRATTLEEWAESWRDPSCRDDCGDQEDPAGCAQNCPQNSHFEACGTSCPATCANPKAPTSCSRPCSSGCQCDEGFLLLNATCVPAETCGCHHQGRSYKVQEEFWEDGSCQRRCRCQAGGQVACKKSGCKAHEKCVVEEGGLPACRPQKFFTCIGTGDPHYTTFDGLKYDFQGTCRYQFAALCSRDPQLVPFTVTVENNNRGSKAVSFTKTVTLEVYGHLISMSQEHPSKVKVNGAFVELPFSLGGQLELYHSGPHGFARTAFGLRVSFDWYSYARVILPEAYAGAVCGLCGNANGDPKDDWVARGGQRATSETQLADSWKVGEVPGCSAGCVGDCPTCRQEEKEVYLREGYCGVIAKAGGPFRACHEAIDPTPFLEDCAFDTCHYKGHRATMCKAIAAYVTECQSHGIRVEPWRTPSFCGPSCPPRSHYELCGTSCPSNCRGGPTPSPQDCSWSPCVEGCFCDPGFLLSGDECVPAGECGCQHGGRYYKKGQEFYPSCRERCRCRSRGVVECQEATCPPQEECRLEEGVLGCYPVGYGRLVVSGDPHYTTFDGRAFHVRGSCAYVLARLCKAHPTLANFSVVLEHDLGGVGGPGGRAVAMTKKVVVAFEAYRVTTPRTRVCKTPQVNGERHTLPLATPDGQLRVGQEGTNIVLQTGPGLRLLYNVATYLLLTVPLGYRGHLCGLGGNYNGDPDDDFRLPDGTPAPGAQEFVASWKVPKEEGGCPEVATTTTISTTTTPEGCEGDHCPPCVATGAAADSCHLIRDPQGPFGPCHLRVNPEEYLEQCLHDVCAAGEEATQVLCHSLQAYATACQATGATIGHWRTAQFCPLPCPPHSHYELCTRTCDFTCASLWVPTPCSWKCFEGCQCDDGFLFDGETCVSLEKCGCLHRGRYVKVRLAEEGPRARVLGGKRVGTGVEKEVEEGLWDGLSHLDEADGWWLQSSTSWGVPSGGCSWFGVSIFTEVGCPIKMMQLVWGFNHQ
ncbi:PREDICTED: IgGFc-binding protein-like [Calidris pugnax]|uniref:IgGFc-binding protein-like n=1 Tax=Calidris pugnax TaxID=198806 RepID=UPI00071E1F10|nr:PREDICTED: IgGFc-binding protein-like [Calidris pugnax]